MKQKYQNLNSKSIWDIGIEENKKNKKAKFKSKKKRKTKKKEKTERSKYKQN